MSFQGVLTGVPHYLGQAESLLEPDATADGGAGAR